jgi:hypothetical protein
MNYYTAKGAPVWEMQKLKKAEPVPLQVEVDERLLQLREGA